MVRRAGTSSSSAARRRRPGARRLEVTPCREASSSTRALPVRLAGLQHRQRRPRRAPRAAPTRADAPRPRSPGARSAVGGSTPGLADDERHHARPPLGVGNADHGGLAAPTDARVRRRSTAPRGTFVPPETTTSSSRPRTSSRPLASNRPTSGVCSQPPCSTSAVSSGWSTYPSNSTGPADQDPVVSPERDLDAVERSPVVDAAAAGLAHPVRRHDADPASPGPVEQVGVRRAARRAAPRRTRRAPRSRRGWRAGGAAGSAPGRGSAADG